MRKPDSYHYPGARPYVSTLAFRLPTTYRKASRIYVLPRPEVLHFSYTFAHFCRSQDRDLVAEYLLA